MPFRRSNFVLTPPSLPLFVVAAALTALGGLIHYKIVAIRALGSLGAYSFEMVFIAAVLLIVGVLLRGV